VVAGHDEERRPEPAQELRRALVLVAPSAVREVAARDHELGLETVDQHRGAALDRLVVPRSVMEVGQV
jgi:hypothetical protein